MKKWYIVSHQDNDSIIHAKISDIKMFHEGGKITSRSRGYDTREELIIDEKILDCNCKKCGSIIKTNWLDPYPKLLTESKLCFSCYHWYVITLKLKDKRQVIIDGTGYYISPDNNESMFQGYGGREFKIKRFDSDEIITTHNLWCQGDISKFWLDELKNNAEFIAINH